MQIEEEHVLPRFEDADTGEGAVLPAGFRDEIGMAPPEPTPSRIRTRFDPEGQGPRQGMTFGENVAGAFRSGTIEGAAREAAELATARREVPAETRDLTALEYLEPFAVGPISPEAAEAARQEARGQIFDQIAYDLAPVAFTPRSVAGSLAGQIMAPTNLLAFGGGVASKALAARGFGKTVQAAAGTAIAAGVTDAATQTVRRGSGAQAEFDIPQAVIAPIAGGLIGAGAHVAGEAIGKGAGSVWRFVKGREASAPQADVDLPREAIDAPGVRNMAALADEDPSLRPGDARTPPPSAGEGELTVTLPEQAVEAPAMDPAAVVADPDAAASRAAADVPEEPIKTGSSSSPPTDAANPLSDNAPGGRTDESVKTGSSLVQGDGAQLATEARQTLDQLDPRIAPAIEQALAPPEAAQPRSAREIIDDLPGSLDGANVDTKRFSRPPSVEELDDLIDAAKAHEAAEVDRVFGADAERAKRLMRSSSDSAYDQLEALVEKHGPEAQAVVYGKAEPAPGDKGIVDVHELRDLREALAHANEAIDEYLTLGETSLLGRELAWLAPKLPDVNAPDASHTTAQRTAVLQLATMIGRLEAAGADPRPALNEAGKFTLGRVSGDLEDTGVLLSRLADFTRRYMRRPEEAGPQAPALAGRTSEPLALIDQTGALGEGGRRPAPSTLEGAPLQRSGPSEGNVARPQLTRQSGGKPLSLMQFIARNGGLALDGEASARDLGKVFVPGAGPLARKNGRTIDGHWREALIDAGYLPADADGATARNVEREVFDALDREQRGERTYSAYDDAPAASEIDTLHREVEAEVKKVAKALKKAGISERETDPRTLTDAGELMWRGEETDALAAYERAAMMRVASDEIRATRVRAEFGELPPGWGDDAILGGAARADGSQPGGGGSLRAGSGPEGGPGRPGRELPRAGEGGQGSERIDAADREAGSAQAAAVTPEGRQGADTGAAEVSEGTLDPIAELERALVARGIPPAPKGLITSPETSLVEAATRLQGLSNGRTIPLGELRAALPGQSPADFDRTLASLRARGLAKVTDAGVSLDQAGVRQVQEAIERHVRIEAEDIGRTLFGPGTIKEDGGPGILFRQRPGGEPAPRRLRFDSPLSGERRVTRAWAEKEIVQRHDQIASLEAEKAGERRIAPIRAQIEGLEKLLPKFDQDLPRGRPFKPQRVIDAGDGLVVRVLDRGDQRTYRLFVQGEDRQPKRALGYVDLDQHADGRWEAMMLHVSAQDRGRGAATTLYKAVEKDLGQERIPSGALLPDGYAFWMKRDPEKVRFHQQVGEQYLSPKRIAAYLRSEAFEGEERAALQAALDRVPPEGKTPEAMALQFRKRALAEGVEEPDQIRQGRPVEDQGTVPIEGDARPERLEALGARFAADFEAILRTGRVQGGARGQFNTSTGVARVRSLADLDTTIHEVGHSLQQSPQTRPLVDPVITGNRGELARLGAGTGETGDAEAFAELFRLYATNRAYAERTYPNATADLERTLREVLPAQAAALDRLRADLDIIHRADSGAVVGSDVITPKPDGLFTRILDLFGADFIGAAATDPRGGVYYAWRDALYTRLLSPHHPINRAMDALGRVFRENTGKTLDLLPQDHAYILARVGSGANVVAQSMLEHGVRGARSDAAAGASFRDAIEAAIGKRYTSEQWHDFGAYLTARSMVADYERFAAGEIPNPPGKLSAADYTRAVQEYDAKFPAFAEGAQKFYEFNTNLLQRHYDKGLFSKEYLDAAMARKDYAPKLRDMEDLGTSALTGGGARRDGASMMKTFRGSQRSVLNPLDSTVKKVYDLEQAAALNDAKAALARLAEIAGPGSGFIAEPIPANKLSSVRVDVVDALRAAGSRANVDSLDLGALIHQAEGMLGDDVFTHIFRQEAIRPGAEPITFYYVNGERRALRLADDAFGRELHTALNAMTTPERNIFLSVLQISGAVLRQGVTKSLGFIYRNFARDQGTSVATGARGYIPFISALQGGFDAVRGGGDFEKYLSFGGFAGGVIHEAVEGSALARGGAQRMFREKNVVSRVLGAGAKAAELSEAATRAGQFQSYVKQAKGLGFDDYNAALYATFKANDYIDFRKVGSHMATVSRWVPFLNASAQGTDKEARALIGDMVRLETKRARGEELSRIEVDNLNDSRAAWVKTMAWGMLFGGGGAYLNSENPEWFGAAAWRRERGYNLFPLGPVGNWFTMPKPFGLVRNISDLFEYGVEYMIRQDPTIAGKLGHALAESHHLPYTNPFIDTFYGARANYDAFRDRAIVPPSLQALPSSEQYTRYTSEVSKGIGWATGWSPMKVDYAFKNLGGGTAIDFLRNVDSLIHWMQDKPGGKAKTIWDLPLARELVQNLSVGSEATTRFYNLVGQKAGTLEQAATAYGQKVASGDRTGAEAYLRGLPANERAYATLQKQGFDSDDKLLHPLVLARAYNAVIAGVSRAIGDRNLIPEGDLDRSNLTLSRRDAKPIELDGPTAEKLRNELDAYAMVTARNSLIAFGADGMQGVPVKDPAEFLERIKLLSPEVARELRGRIAAKRLYDPDVVRERWPEAKARLLRDGENADLSDLEPRRPKSGKRERKKAMVDE